MEVSEEELMGMLRVASLIGGAYWEEHSFKEIYELDVLLKQIIVDFEGKGSE